MATHKGNDKHEREAKAQAEQADREAKAQAKLERKEQQQAAVEQGPSHLVEEPMVQADTSVMEAQERQWNEDPHPEAQRQRFDAERPLMPGPDGMMRPPAIQVVDLDGGFVLAVMSVEADPNAPNLAGRVRIRTILAMDRDGLEGRIATTLVSDFGLTPEAAEAVSTGNPMPPPQVTQDGMILTDAQRQDASQPGYPPAREA